MAERQWRAAVVGVGVVGDWHVQILSKMPNVTLVAVCDPLVDKVKATLATRGLGHIPVYALQKQMHSREQLDVVHICTPSGNHMKPAILAMKAGVNVICEKPMEIKLDRIDKMIASASENKVKLAGIFQNRWNLANRALYDAAREGRFGRIAWGGSITPWYRTDQYYRDGGWRGTWKLDGGGAMMNQSVHNVDLIQWICGPVETVSAHASSRIHAEIEVEDTLSCALTFENGAHGTIVGTTAIYPGAGVRIEVGGEFGHAVSEDGLKRFTFKDARPADEALMTEINTTKPPAAGSAAINQGLDLHYQNISSILASWDRGEEAATWGPEARKAIAIILAMYKSAKNSGRSVRVGS